MLLEYGSVIHSFVEHIIPPKYKFLVCINEELQWFLLVNTENRENYECIEISALKYSFLKNQNRFVSCCKIVELPKNSNLKIIGQIDKEDMLKIYNNLHQSKRLLLSKKQKIRLP